MTAQDIRITRLLDQGVAVPQICARCGCDPARVWLAVARASR